MKVDHVKLWLANCSLGVNHGLDVLRQKSLISIDMDFLKMHSLLQQLGVEIVRESNKKPRKRHFLVDNDISDVFTDKAVSIYIVISFLTDCVSKYRLSVD